MLVEGARFERSFTGHDGEAWTTCNNDLAYVVIQPGVTQLQLSEYLIKNNSTLFLSITGSSPHASIIGNLMERGDGKGPYCDKYKYSSDFEVVLPTGDVISTGSSQFKSNQAAHLDKYGVGPVLDGLFSQSNLGIITQATIQLCPKPTHLSTCISQINSDQMLSRYIDSLRNLKLKKIITGNFIIINDFKAASTLDGFPWKKLIKLQ